MLTTEQNERYTRVEKGTPCGELMRRYWHPIAASGQLPEHGTKPVTILGERLVLYRDRSGKLGLVEAHCPHRRGGMVFGIPEETGIRCAYHGWLFDGTGRCLEQPYEQIVDPGSTFKDRVRIGAYPVEELGGLIFAYLGPEPAPLLPRWDVFVKENVIREIGWAMIPCNWLQITENPMDSTHVAPLHGRFSRYVLERLGRPDLQRVGGSAQPTTPRASRRTEFGRLGQRLVDGKWILGGATVFPYTLGMPDGSFQISVPADDTHTLYIYYFTYDPADLKRELGLDWPPQKDPREIPVFQVPVPDILAELDWPMLDNNSGQDLGMICSQGAIVDRSRERLGQSDQGIVLYRQLLEEQIQAVESGREPMNTFRDPIRNQCVQIERGTGLLLYRNRDGVERTVAARKYSPIFRAAVIKERGEEALKEPVH